MRQFSVQPGKIYLKYPSNVFILVFFRTGNVDTIRKLITSKREGPLNKLFLSKGAVLQKNKVIFLVFFNFKK